MLDKLRAVFVVVEEFPQRHVDAAHTRQVAALRLRLHPAAPRFRLVLVHHLPVLVSLVHRARHQAHHEELVANEEQPAIQVGAVAVDKANEHVDHDHVEDADDGGVLDFVLYVVAVVDAA